MATAMVRFGAYQYAYVFYHGALMSSTLRLHIDIFYEYEQTKADHNHTKHTT